MADLSINKLNGTLQFGVALKVLPTEGNLVYEYNPFYNYRLDHTMIFYKNSLMEIEEFCKEVGIPYNGEDTFKGKTSWDGIIPKTETPPVVYLKGLLVDFETDELEFSLNNPIEITPLWSYDNSVNLIINDGKNPPRLINSRFSPTEKNKYLVCNRKGNNDSNIYDLGEQFDIDTSLYKKINKIPLLSFLGVEYGGNLSIGNYHFYFKYVDADGNESDFFAESGLVSIFIGNSGNSIHSGFRDENSYKQVRFRITNTDPGYLKVLIYYTRATSDVMENAVVSAFRVDLEFTLNDNGNSIIILSGFEEKTEVPLSEVNLRYLIYGSVETQATAQNMLFLANVDKPKIPYEDLADCALRMIPLINTDEKYDLTLLGTDYLGNITNTYYDPNYIYSRVGYWDDEIYRLGVVYILSDNTLTDVFNIRGGKLYATEAKTTTYNDFTNDAFFDNGKRKYLSYDEQYYTIIKSEENSASFKQGTVELENSKGVIHINSPKYDVVNGITIQIRKETFEYLRDVLNIKGFFFVRLKRIPTTLCQAYTIGIDRLSNTPLLPILSPSSGKMEYLAESFIAKNNDGDLVLTHNFRDRQYFVEDYQVRVQGAICPEYDVNYPYLNSLFSGSLLVCRKCNSTNILASTDIENHFKPQSYNFVKSDDYANIKVIGVEDNTKLVAINNYMFSARAGEAEEGYRYEYIGQKILSESANNLLRASFGPFLGITGYEYPGQLIDIKIPGYSPGFLREYFLIRYNDKAPYYAISERYSFDQADEWSTNKTSDIVELDKALYRGDCYICQFTHRVNRNFSDPNAPTNDEIVDPKTWKEHFKITDGVVDLDEFGEINTGDLNAVLIGMYVTLAVRSSINLNVRSLDRSYTDEEALYGHCRGFYPYYPLTTRGAYKIPEALCYNKGFEKSVSERYNIEVPDVPWIKNEFSNRIAYSNILVKDAFNNGWRVFNGTHFNDYPKTYGSITKIIELLGNILCVFEHGVALIPINERAVAGEGAGGSIFINTSNVLPDNPKILSDTFGSQWKESIIKTPNGVYGVDTIGKKIWKTDGNRFECISDFHIQEFLNNNISLTERELTPIIGIRNVKTHYNNFKGDVMFTFYDNLYGFEEKVWNLCYNERLGKWITFYSWVPSYSENIYNQYFSFDRNTSKWIAKLGTSCTGSDFADGVTLENYILTGNGWSTKLALSNRNIPENSSDIKVDIEYELCRDNYGNHKLFDASLVKSGTLRFIGDYNKVKSEFYKRDSNGKIIKNDRGQRLWLSRTEQTNPDNVVILLNIRAHVFITYLGNTPTIGEAMVQGFTNGTKVDAGYFESVVAVIPLYNMQFLTTDFWRHGLAGIIDISDKVYPTYWYGKQHPFEFEFVIANNPDKHKIFDNLVIISNNAEPESFHYEVIGDSYEFADDKKNMYIRQEATKELYQFNGANISYDHEYSELDSEPRDFPKTSSFYLRYYEKSTIFPLYYFRQDTIDEIEDTYPINTVEDYHNTFKDKDGKLKLKDYAAMAGAEIVRYDTLDEYRVWNHCRAIDMRDYEQGGRMRGNMMYLGDRWQVQINPINYVQRNESVEEWKNVYAMENPGTKQMVPAECNIFPPPANGKYSHTGEITLPDTWERGIIDWDINDNMNKEVKVRDKWLKVRIRYSGKKLAIIQAIQSLYSIMPT